MNTEEKIAVMQAFVDGQKIEVRDRAHWWQIAHTPGWNWLDCEYRIAKVPDSINWNNVAPEYKYMARDANDFVWLYNTKPCLFGSVWDAVSSKARAEAFASYKRGTVDWRDSLVERPQ